MRGLVLLAAVFQLCQGAPQYQYPIDISGHHHPMRELLFNTDTGDILSVPTRPDVYYGKREAEADPQVIVPRITTPQLPDISKILENIFKNLREYLQKSFRNIDTRTNSRS